MPALETEPAESLINSIPVWTMHSKRVGVWDWSVWQGQRAYLPTRSLEAAGASGAALGCAEAEAPLWVPGHQPG